MMRQLLLIPVIAGAVALSACSNGSGGNNPSGNAPNKPATEIFAQLQCGDGPGTVEGPLDALQEPLVNELGGALADIPQIGASAESIVIAVAHLLDVVDALATSMATLAAEQDPEAGFLVLDGTASAIQCASKSLYEAYVFSPLAGLAPREVNALVAELAALATVFDGADSLGAKGLEDLTARLAGVADAIADIVQILPADIGVFPDALPLDYSALVQAPAVLLNNLADTLRFAGQLDGQATADAVTNTLTDLLGLLEATLAFQGNGSPLSDLLMTLEEQLSQGLGMLLVPLFDAIAGAFGNDEAGFGSGIFAGFLAGGMQGSSTNPLADYLGGGAPDGVDRLRLSDVLAGLPILGNLLDRLLG